MINCHTANKNTNTYFPKSTQWTHTNTTNKAHNRNQSCMRAQDFRIRCWHSWTVGEKKNFVGHLVIFTRPDMFVFTLLAQTWTPRGSPERSLTHDLCPAYCCKIIARTKWNLGAVTKMDSATKWSQNGKKGFADVGREKLTALGGSRVAVFKLLLFVKEIRPHL